MPDTKITALTAIGANPIIPSTFPIPMVDLTDTSMAASGTTKKVTVNQILGAGGTATLASATITGDLTVDTSTLKVDSANNRVGVGTASPALPFVVSNAGAQGFEINPNGSIVSGGIDILSYNRSTSLYKGVGFAAESYLFRVGTVSATDAMTLNSTGLGVGGSPLTKIFASVTPPGAGQDGVRVSDGTRLIQMSISGSTYSYQGIGANQNVIYAAGNPLSILSDANNLRLGTSATSYLLLDTSGNVGIGVQPSAWGSPFKALQVSRAGLRGSTATTGLSFNTYSDGTNLRYIAAGLTALDYYQNSGSHVWQIAGVGANAGDPITFTQAMTLTAGGDLLVGKTATNSGTVGVEIQPNGNVWATKSASTSAATAWDTYSTGAGAYRFYVGMDGTVNATNTTISAISDARLKENVQDIDVGLGAILALKPRKFDWKAGKGKDIKGDRGFIAQEFEQVFPQLVDEWKDPAPEGEAPYKSVRQDLIPVLVKAIQELAAEVNALKNA